MTRGSGILLAVAIVMLVGGVSWKATVTEAEANVVRADPNVILRRFDLARLALPRGEVVFARSCSACHGVGGKGDTNLGVPDLTDDDFLYGMGSAQEIEQIVLHGIRAGDSKGWNLASMPAYGRAVPYGREKIPPLNPRQMADVVAYLRAADGGPADSASVERGHAVYLGSGGCYDCHGNDARGDNAIGAPNLIDNKWLYGAGSEADIHRSVSSGRNGVSPSFRSRMSAYDIRAVSVFVASLHPAPTN